MRQGGFVPKNHDSGVYWVRANANSGNQGKENMGDEKTSGTHLFVVAFCVIMLISFLVH